MKNRSADTVFPQSILSKEEACQLVFDNLDTGFVLAGKDFRIIAANELTKKRIREYIGIELTEQSTVFDLVPAVYREEIDQIFKSVFKGEPKILETTIIKEGVHFYFENHFIPACNSS